MFRIMSFIGGKSDIFIRKNCFHLYGLELFALPFIFYSLWGYKIAQRQKKKKPQNFLKLHNPQSSASWCSVYPRTDTQLSFKPISHSFTIFSNTNYTTLSFVRYQRHVENSEQNLFYFRYGWDNTTREPCFKAHLPGWCGSVD